MVEIITLNIELKETTLNEADTMMQKILKACNYEELDKIVSAKVTKTIAEVTVDSDIFEDKDDGR